MNRAYAAEIDFSEMSTIYDVAARAGVSPSTVSRVVNGTAGVAIALTDRVNEAIRVLDYRPNRLARGLRTQRSGSVAVVVPDIANSFFTAVVRGVEEVAQQHGLLVVLGDTNDDPTAERAYLHLVAAQQMEGAIVATSAREGTDFEELAALRLPVVLVDREIDEPSLPTVMTDNVEGARLATRHLIEVGATRIGCVTGPMSTTTSVRRLDGYRDALRSAGIPVRQALVRHADYRVAGGRAAVADLLTERPDALFVGNNLMTMGALQAIADAGRRVPDDMLLVGFDEEEWSEYWRPSISTIAQPARDIGRTAMRLLLDRMGGGQGPRSRVLLQPELRVRDSSRPPAEPAPVPAVTAPRKRR